jgi:dTDP-4-amino-4,6-dideoxy-D-galactose acyltransferase
VVPLRTTQPPCELLEWDTEHFGFPIARVAADTVTPETAEVVDEWCADQGIRCLYFKADARDAESARVAASNGYRMVDVRLIARRSLEGVVDLPTGPENVAVREATEADIDYARRLAARSHDESRFYFDGGFPPERCDALYQAWVDRGFRDPDRGLRVPVVEGEPAGYQVLAPLGPERESHGELVAIDERHRRKGVGWALHVSTYRLYAERGAVTHRSATSIRSRAAIRLHERLGFLTSEVQVWHHKWYP